ncbi:MAG: biotin synthase, partial [Candidatus Macondimonas sp.]
MLTPSSVLAQSIRHDWLAEEVQALFAWSFPDLLFTAQSLHRRHFDPGAVQISTLLSIKTGGCPEDCAYCPQSVHFDSGVERQKLMELETVLAAARRARDAGATRFCMGAA